MLLFFPQVNKDSIASTQFPPFSNSYLFISTQPVEYKLLQHKRLQQLWDLLVLWKLHMLKFWYKHTIGKDSIPQHTWLRPETEQAM